MFKLNELKKGYIGIINDIKGDKKFKVRLFDMGFNKGESVECILVSPSKNIKAYLIKNTLVSLRDSDAENVLVEVFDENSINR